MFDTLLLADVIANYVYIVTNRLMLLSVMVCFGFFWLLLLPMYCWF